MSKTSAILTPVVPRYKTPSERLDRSYQRTDHEFTWAPRVVYAPRCNISTTRVDLLLVQPSFCFLSLHRRAIVVADIVIMARSISSLSLPVLLRLVLAFYVALAVAVSSQEPLVGKSQYKVGDAIPVTCLNRTVYV